MQPSQCFNSRLSLPRAGDLVAIGRQVVEVEAVEPGRVAAQHLMGVLFIQLCADIGNRSIAAQQGAFIVGVVVAPHQAPGADEVDIAETHRIVGDRDGALTVKIVARLVLQLAHVQIAPRLHLIHELEEPGQPAAFGLGDDEPQVGELIQGAGADQLDNRRHAGRGAKGGADQHLLRIGFILVADPLAGQITAPLVEVADTGEIATDSQIAAENMKVDRYSGLFGEAPQGVPDIQMIRLPRHCGRQEQGAKTPVDTAPGLGHAFIDVVDRQQGGDLEALPVAGEGIPGVVVVGSRPGLIEGGGFRAQ